MRRFALLLAVLCCAVASCRTPPVVELQFEGVVLDATSGDPVVDAEVSMTVRECASSGSICLDWRTRTTAGPVRTGPDGTFSLSVAAPEDIEGSRSRPAATSLPAPSRTTTMARRSTTSSSSSRAPPP
ncbi:MAG: hypothetical protein M5U28_47945 [Sandaracinaceae bacterium]|nr:hypothetical protein [Sandaracinaceae bacterium]